MFADHSGHPGSPGCAALGRHPDSLLLPAAATTLTPLVAVHFGLTPDTLDAPTVLAYPDGSGAVLTFRGACDASDDGRAQPPPQVSVVCLSVTGGAPESGLDAVREEFDHPGVRIVALDAPGWSLAYAVMVDARARFAGGPVLRFQDIRGTATLSVTFSGMRGPVDHQAARALADRARASVGWSGPVERAASSD